jgi:tetratricopeptide (TPR) repeat protein
MFHSLKSSSPSQILLRRVVNHQYHHQLLQSILIPSQSIKYSLQTRNHNSNSSQHHHHKNETPSPPSNINNTQVISIPTKFLPSQTSHNSNNPNVHDLTTSDQRAIINSITLSSSSNQQQQQQTNNTTTTTDLTTTAATTTNLTSEQHLAFMSLKLAQAINSDKLHEAFDLTTEILLKLKRHPKFGPNSSAFASALSDRAFVLKQLNEFDESISLYEESLKIYNRLLEPNLFYKARILGNYGNVLRAKANAFKVTSAGRKATFFARAHAAMKESYDIYVKLEGEEGTNSVQALVKLANFTKDQPNGMPEAEKMLRFAISAYEKQINIKDTKRKLAAAQNDLAFLLKRMNKDFEESVVLYESAIALATEFCGETSRDSIVYRHNLADLLESHGHDEIARPIREELLRIIGYQDNTSASSASSSSSSGEGNDSKS